MQEVSGNSAAVQVSAAAVRRTASRRLCISLPVEFCEHWFTTRFYKKIREFGALLVRQGVVQDVEDIFHLRYVEIEQALADAALAWAAGSSPAGASHWRPIIARRKAIIETAHAFSIEVAGT